MYKDGPGINRGLYTQVVFIYSVICTEPWGAANRDIAGGLYKQVAFISWWLFI